MNRRTLAFFFVILATSVTARAASHEHEHDMSAHQTQQTAATHSGTGVLKAVNTAAGKVQLAHEAIPSLGWPAMTMWFALRESLPKDLKVGDAVRFELAQENGKQWVIVTIRRK